MYMYKSVFVVFLTACVNLANAESLSSLIVLNDVQTGVWTVVFDGVAKNPMLPKSTETLCATRAQIIKNFSHGLYTNTKTGAEISPTVITVNTPTLGVAEVNFPAQQIGATAIPASAMIYTIQQVQKDKWLLTMETSTSKAKIRATATYHDEKTSSCSGKASSGGMTTEDAVPTSKIGSPTQPSKPLKPERPKPITAKPPSSIGVEAPKPKIVEPAASSCAGVFEGLYEGELHGKLRIGIDKTGKLFEGVGSTGGRGELVGIETFHVAGRSEVECDIDLAGTWLAPLFSPYAGRSQYMRFTGFSSEDEINGRYRYDNDPSSPLMGSFHLTRVK